MTVDLCDFVYLVYSISQGEPISENVFHICPAEGALPLK